MEMTSEDLPFLGEPQALELANSRYGEQDWAFDFLDDACLALWLAHSPHPVRVATLGRPGVGQLRALRDAVVELFDAAVAQREPKSKSFAVIEQARAACSTRTRFTWAHGRPTTTATFAGTRRERVLASYAHDAITLATGPQWAAISRCAAPDCTMLFVRQHRRRRFCHPGCSQRVRQAAYHRRQRAAR